MKPRIIERGPMILLGVSFFGDPFELSGGWTEENEIGRLWQRFLSYLERNGDRVKGIKDPELAYEVHITHEETALKGEFEVFVGVEVEGLEDVPVELLVKILPASTYAVFTLEGAAITTDWGKMIQEWMLGSGYDQAHQYGFQCYDQRFRGVDEIEASVLDVYVPVIKPGA